MIIDLGGRVDRVCNNEKTCRPGNEGVAVGGKMLEVAGGGPSSNEAWNYRLESHEGG